MEESSNNTLNAKRIGMQWSSVLVIALVFCNATDTVAHYISFRKQKTEGDEKNTARTTTRNQYSLKNTTQHTNTHNMCLSQCEYVNNMSLSSP